MKIKRCFTSFMLSGLLVLAFPVRADETLIWNPSNKTDPSEMGGDGIWNQDGKTWWDGSENAAYGSAAAPFGSATNTNTTLVFKGSGTVTKNFTSSFQGGGLSHTLSFEEGANYTFIASNALTGSQPMLDERSAAYLTINAKSGASVLFQGSDNRTLVIRSRADNTTLPGLNFTGGGSINFGSGAIVQSNSRNSKFVILDGTAVTFSTGSVYTSEGGSETDTNARPFYTSRIAVQDGILNISGGMLYAGYRGSAASNAEAGYGLVIGRSDSGNGGTVNISAGYLYALGDPRNQGGIYAGVSFGSSDSNKGGTLNLTGGVLETSNIRVLGASATGTAILNLDGGTLRVSTDRATGDTATDGLQARLNQFIYGFTNSETRHVALGEGGTQIDTGSIDATLTNGIATIDVVLRNMEGKSGTFTKIGANTLRLTKTNSYTGATRIDGGTLALASGASIATSSEIAINNAATFDISAVSEFTLAANQVLSTHSSGNITGSVSASGALFVVNGSLTIDGDLTAGSDTVFSFDLGDPTAVLSVIGALDIDSDAILDLSQSSVFGEGLYTLFTGSSITAAALQIANGAPDEFSYHFINTGTSLQLNVLAAIPEAASTVLLFGVLSSFGIFCKRRR